MSVVLSEHLPLLATAPDGIQKLRGLIFELAVRGKLVPQDPNDEPASELLKRIAKERARLEDDTTRKKMLATPPVNDDEQPFTIPRSWQWVRLGSTVEVLDSLRKPVTKDARQPGPYPYYGASGIVDYVAEYLFDEELVLVGEDGAKWGVGDRTAFSITGKTWVNNHAHVLRPDRSLLIDGFLVHALVARNLQPFITGTTVPKLNQAKLVSIELPLPPLAEQHRIVAKVDELMALCDRLEAEQADAGAAHERLVATLLGTLTQSTDTADLAANWQRLAEHFDTLFTTESSLDALKQTILQLAVMGKLVPQNPNDEPASELLKRIAKERARLEAEGKIKRSGPMPAVAEDKQPFAIPSNWVWIRLAELGPEFQNGESSRGTPGGSKIVVLRLADISKGAVSLSDTRSVELPESSIEKYRLSKNDLLVIRVNGSAEIVGRLVLCESDLEAIYCDHFIRARVTETSIAPRYLRMTGDSLLVRQQIQSLFITTAGQKTVNQGHIGGLLIALPPLAEQHRIVAKVDELMALCDSLKAGLAESRTQQDRLATTLIESALKAA